MDRPGSPRGSFSESLQRQQGQKCLTCGDFSMGREIDMTSPHMNKMKPGLRSKLRLQGERGVFRMEFHNWAAGNLI